MAYVVTRRCLIGEWREAGYVCTSEDLRGRDVRRMEDKERTIRFDPTVLEPVGNADGGDGEDGYAGLSVAQLKDALIEREVDVPKGAKKADLVALLEQHDEGSADGDDADGGDGESSEDQPEEE